MPQTALTNLGLDYDWDLASDAWKTGMDDNLALLDNLAQAVVTVALGSVSAEPGSPVNGEAHIIGASPVTGASWAASPERVGWFAVWYTNTGWHFAEPRAGWKIFDQTSGDYYFYDGTNWVPSHDVVTDSDQAAGNYTLTLADANSMVRLSDNGGAQTVFIDGSIPFPAGTIIYIHKSSTQTVTISVTGSPTPSLRESSGEAAQAVDTDYVMPGRYSTVMLYHQGAAAWRVLEFNNVPALITEVGAGSPLTYMLSSQERDGTILIDNTVPINILIPANATLELPIGYKVKIVKQGTGDVRLEPDSGVTINKAGGPSSPLITPITTRYQWVELLHTAANDWLVLRDGG